MSREFGNRFARMRRTTRGLKSDLAEDLKRFVDLLGALALALGLDEDLLD